ncbi:putative reverse transcriptase domain-containing protein [Tanacetum coccineum]|uniref:Reverse transcriptase domain-containing protein n=1 Tax=Tanacetum coccineum TaxID=301880 RepID=A0ABQ5EBB0_9ASTR
MMLEDLFVEAVFRPHLLMDYVMGPEYPPLPDFVSEPVYPEFMPSDDDMNVRRTRTRNEEEAEEEDPASGPTLCPPPVHLCYRIGCLFRGSGHLTPSFDTWDEMVEDMQGTPAATDVAGLSQRMTDFVTTVRQDTDEIYGRLDDAQEDTSLMSGQLNILRRDRCAHARTARLMETEARQSCDAWVQSMDATDRTRQAQLMETLTLMRTLETHVTALQSQQGPVGGPAQPEALIDQGVANALAARDADRSRNGKDSHDSGTSVRRQAPSARDNCIMENQIKFATCTLLGSALTWWNAYVRTVGHDVAYAMTCTNLKKMMTNKYCPRGEIKKLEVEMWNHKVKGTDVVDYNQRFQDLALMCARMFPEESDKIEKYIGGFPDMIHRSVMASKPKTMQDAIEFTTELMDKKNRIFAK